MLHALDHLLISSHPDTDGGELDEGEVIGGVLLVAGGDGPEVLELVEEALDEIAVAIEEGAEGGLCLRRGHAASCWPRRLRSAMARRSASLS